MSARSIALDPPVRRPFRFASPATAFVLGGVALALLAVAVTLTVVARDPWATNDGLVLVLMFVYGAMGVVIARREPGNAIGWLLIALALVVLVDCIDRLYLILDYRQHGGSLPFGGIAYFWGETITIFAFLLGLPAILIFPDGRAPSRRWRRLLGVYVAVATWFMLGQIAGSQACSWASWR
jgi:hypothetical protein